MTRDELDARRAHTLWLRLRRVRKVSNGRLRSGYQPTGGARIHRPARPERGARARAIRRRLVAIRIQPPTLEYLCADRRAAGAAQEARPRARGCLRALGRAGVRDVPARTEIPVRRAPVRVRQGALRRTRHCARRLGGASAGRYRELELLRCARRPVLLYRPRPGPAPMGRCGDVSTDRHAAAARRGAAQLPADGVVAGSQDRRGDRFPPGGTHPLLWHVDRVRGRHGALRPYGPGAARRDGHVRPGLALELAARPVRTPERLTNAEERANVPDPGLSTRRRRTGAGRLPPTGPVR